MAGAPSSGDKGGGCLFKLSVVAFVLCLLFFGWVWAEDQVHNHGRQPVPDVPDRTPCTVRCDRSGQGMP